MGGLGRHRSHLPERTTQFGVLQAHGHLFEAWVCWVSRELQIPALEDLRYGEMYTETLRKEELQDAIPIFSFEASGAS